VAATVRARLLARHRLGRAGCDELAHASAAEAAELLAGSAYARRVQAGMGPADLAHAVASTCVWHLRVLGGWVPVSGTGLLRVLGAGFELENVEGRLAALEGVDGMRTFDLGPLATVAPRVAAAADVGAVREALRASAWGDPGSDDPLEIVAGLRLSWARRIAAVVPDGTSWGAGMAALVVARERFVTGRPDGPWLRQAPFQLGVGWGAATNLTDLRDRLSSVAAWVLADVEDPEDLWRAEAAWWKRVESDALRRLAAARPGPDVVVGAVAVLLADVWRARAALAAGTYGDPGQEAFDAVA
jgi:hypothetical protein